MRVLFFLAVCLPVSLPATAAINADLQSCVDDELAVRFLCSPEWEIESEHETILIILSDEPAVTMTVARALTPMMSPLDLSRADIQVLGNYGDGFRTQIAEIAGQEALNVIGTSDIFPEIGLLDFYTVRDLHLYSILFAVDPKEDWVVWEDLVYEIKDSLEFLDTLPADDE